MIGIGCVLASVRSVRADPPAPAQEAPAQEAPAQEAPAQEAPAQEAATLPAPFAPLEVLLTATDLVVEGMIGAPTGVPAGVSADRASSRASSRSSTFVAIDVRRTVAGAEAGRRVFVARASADGAASLRDADLRRPPGTALLLLLLLLLLRASPTASAWTLVSSVDLASIEDAVLDLEGRPGGAADHVETAAFFARLAGDRGDPARDAACRAEGVRTGTPYLQQNLRLRVTGSGAFAAAYDPVVGRVRAARASP